MHLAACYESSVLGLVLNTVKKLFCPTYVALIQNSIFMISLTASRKLGNLVTDHGPTTGQLAFRPPKSPVLRQSASSFQDSTVAIWYGRWLSL